MSNLRENFIKFEKTCEKVWNKLGKKVKKKVLELFLIAYYAEAKIKFIWAKEKGHNVFRLENSFVGFCGGWLFFDCILCRSAGAGSF